MSLDHYVSQVHLKNFYSPKLGKLMYAIRKKDLKAFTPNSESVCRIDNGSTNSYMQNPRIIEDFLEGVEPKYNNSLNKLRDNKIDLECIYVIAGFVAYVLACSPAGMRLHSTPLKSIVEETCKIAESGGFLPAPPPELGCKSLAELLNNEKVIVEIDHKYPQAIGISSILSLTSTFGNCSWDILINPFYDNPFFTSDFPIAIEETKDPRVLNKIVPLAPNLAIRILPNLSLDINNTDFSFSNFHYKYKKLSRAEVTVINRRIVRCAESTVFFRDNLDWIPRFVQKNASYRIEPKTCKFPHEDGTLLWSSQEAIEIT